jgi:N-methylhydantoinase A
VPYDQTGSVEAYADVRFQGQSHELKVRVERPTREHIEQRFREAYESLYGQAPAGREVEIVTLRVRRLGRAPAVELPLLRPGDADKGVAARVELTLENGQRQAAPVLTRTQALSRGDIMGPAVFVDDEATTYLPPGWGATTHPNGTLVLAGL